MYSDFPKVSEPKFQKLSTHKNDLFDNSWRGGRGGVMWNPTLYQRCSHGLPNLFFGPPSENGFRPESTRRQSWGPLDSVRFVSPLIGRFFINIKIPPNSRRCVNFPTHAQTTSCVENRHLFLFSFCFVLSGQPFVARKWFLLVPF